MQYITMFNSTKEMNSFITMIKRINGESRIVIVSTDNNTLVYIIKPLPQKDFENFLNDMCENIDKYYNLYD